MLAESFQQVTVDARVSPSRAIVWGVGGKRWEKEIKRLADCFCALLQEYGQLLDDTQVSWVQCLGQHVPKASHKFKLQRSRIIHGDAEDLQIVGHAAPHPKNPGAFAQIPNHV